MSSTNFYKELELDPTLPDQELDRSLKDVHRKWQTRINAPSLERRQEAERMIQLIEAAKPVLLDPSKRKQYDASMLVPQTVAGQSPVESSVTYEVLSEGTAPIAQQETNYRTAYQADEQDEEDEPLTPIEALLEQAEEYIDNERYYEAIKKVNEAIAIDSSDDNIYSVLAWALHGTGQTANAILEMERAIELNPYFSGYYYNMALLYNEHPILNDEECLRSGQKWLSEALRRDPEDFSYRYHLAYLHRRNDKYGEALSILEDIYRNWTDEQAEDCDFGFIDLKNEMALIHYKLGQKYAKYNKKANVDYYIRKEDVDQAFYHQIQALKYVVDSEQRSKIDLAIRYIEKSKQRVFFGSRFSSNIKIPIFLIVFSIIAQPNFNNVGYFGAAILILSAILNYIPRWKYDQIHYKEPCKKHRNCRCSC
ncbi:tetratricopeptide repeat protein [Paenibacillus agilis]|uniref:Tetratricopeptide repeat protein n=1 Tax=Paenibacillus agilis TaxID=3020863 RepID=A0A559IWQ1_9BACL|nr:tetratricopeptide repeat protein [Paenibacillus agilis]TVX92059.1 tetratricopeptide repeat protein [Paenibacillus agilis]